LVLIIHNHFLKKIYEIQITTFYDHQFFHGTYWFVEVFQIIENNASLILINYFQRAKTTHSLILKYFKLELMVIQMFAQV
jgi:hypothetical protein